MFVAELVKMPIRLCRANGAMRRSSHSRVGKDNSKDKIVADNRFAVDREAALHVVAVQVGEIFSQFLEIGDSPRDISPRKFEIRLLHVSFTVKRVPPKSKEDLDKELEQYMVNTKTSLDRELGIY